MINYALSLVIPANTSVSDPYSERVKLTVGRLSQLYLHGAPEHQHQVRIAVYRYGHRIFPEGEPEWFYPSEYPAQFYMDVPLDGGIEELEVVGANEDDTYEHTVYLMLSVARVIPIGAD